LRKKVAVTEPLSRNEFQRLLRRSDEEVLRRFDEVRARIGERSASVSEEEIAADVAAARAELPD